MTRLAEVLRRRLDPPDAPQPRRFGPPLALGEHPRIGIDGHRLFEERCQVDRRGPPARADVEQAPVTVERELALQTSGPARASRGAARPGSSRRLRGTRQGPSSRRPGDLEGEEVLRHHDRAVEVLARPGRPIRPPHRAVARARDASGGGCRRRCGRPSGPRPPPRSGSPGRRSTGPGRAAQSGRAGRRCGRACRRPRTARRGRDTGPCRPRSPRTRRPSSIR